MSHDSAPDRSMGGRRLKAKTRRGSDAGVSATVARVAVADVVEYWVRRCVQKARGDSSP